jgi:hypothetical protein
MQKLMSTTTTLTLAGQPKTVAEAIAILNSRIQATTAVITAKATWKQGLEGEEALLSQTKQLVVDLKTQLALLFKGNPEALAALGITLPKQHRVLTSEELVQRMALAKATRKLRNTMGSQQKKNVKATRPGPQGSEHVAPNGSTPAAPVTTPHGT